MTSRLFTGPAVTSSGRRLVVAAVIAALSVVLSAPVSAHSDLRRSRPVDGQTMSNPINQVDLVFWSSVSGTEVTVRNPEGTLVPGQTSQVDDVTVRFAMAPTTAAGSYTVGYRATSSDGDPVAGSITFTYVPQPSGLDGLAVMTFVVGLALVIWASVGLVRRRSAMSG